MKTSTDFNNMRTSIEAIARFRDERGWAEQNETLMLTNSLVVEVGELLELFLWNTEKRIAEKAKDNKMRVKIADELSDILYHVMLIAGHFKIDLPNALKQKMDKNIKKYPVTSEAKMSRYKNM